MANLEQLDPLLQSLQALKPPGASKGKISAITTLCVENVQSESVIAQRLYRHFRRTPGTHKLGVLYVIDSVTRQWIEKARQSGQELAGGSAPDGSFASAVHKITELLPALIDDLIQNAPQDHKVKVENLVQIWERGNTFPAKLLADLKAKLAQPASASYVKSFTPPGEPPQELLVSLGLRQSSNSSMAQQAAPPASALNPPPVPQPDASSILAALAKMQPMPAAPAPAPAPVQQQQPASSAPDLSALLRGTAQAPLSATPSNIQQSFVPPPNQAQYLQQYPPQLPFPAAAQRPIPPSYAQYYQSQTPAQQAPPPPPQAAAQNPMAALAALLPPHILNNPEALTSVLSIFQGLAQQGIPQDQWAPVIAALYPQHQQASQAAPSWAPPQDNHPSRDQYAGYRDRSRDRGRGRSRSPDNHRRETAANRRGSPVYGTYDASLANNHADTHSYQSDKRGRGRGGRNGRQNTPLAIRNDRTESPQISQGIAPKWTDIDPSIPAGHIKVLSRTLFVGGANGTEAELRAMFSRFGQVQTCIANEDKRHAFVKMCTRNDAVAAKTALESNRDPEILAKARQTKWGVGFGPRECCDYATGISVIPIDTLTEADHKWMLTAEFGGTGGRPIESGLVVEEPDIEIGAGVSSKAMSRRVGPENGGTSGGAGGKRNRGGNGGSGNGGGGRFRQPEHARESPRPESYSTVNPPPPVPGFGFNFAMPGGYQ